MLRAALAPVLLLALAAPAARADPILYATAATTGEVTSYCLGAGGGLIADPRQRINTNGNAPSRLITTELPGGRFLYVAENDRVEVFRIGDDGQLTRQGRIPSNPLPNSPGDGLLGMNPHDLSIAVASDGTQVLYVPQRAFDRIATFPLDASIDPPDGSGQRAGLSTVRTGVCTTGTDCSNTTCPAGQTCIVNNQCVPIAPSCQSDADCGTTQSCSGGLCVPRVTSCTDDSACAVNQTCTGGVCSPSASCTSDSGCAPGQSCVGGTCASCTTDAQCGSGRTCENGACVTVCDPRATVNTCTGATPTCSPISDATGASCVLGPVPSEWEDVDAVAGVSDNGLLYTSRAVSRGEVFTYRLEPNGDLMDGIRTVNQMIGPEVSSRQCTRTKGCTTGTVCRVAADCGAAPGANVQCAANKCVDLSVTCETDKQCPGDQTCQGFSPCDQDNKYYVVNSEDCTTPVVLTDINGLPIFPLSTPNSARTVNGQIEPDSRRRRLNGASALILRNDLLYVSERFRRAISVFELCPAGGSPPTCPIPASSGRKKGERCTCPELSKGVPNPTVVDLCPTGGFDVDAKFNDNGVCTVRNRQARLAKNGGRTQSDIRYNAMAIAQGMSFSSILGAQFLDGRIDGYRLKSDGRLPRDPTRRTKDNFRTSPFHVFLYRPSDVRPDESAGVLYVGAGDIDRVQAYRLDRNGLPKDRTPFSQTTALTDTFPNDVTIVDLPGPCR